MTKKYSREEAINSFWNKVNIKGSDDCWEWMGALHQQGYGLVRWEGKVYRAHRLSYQLSNENFNRKMHVCHKCDNPTCVNPNHLWLGTNLDNSLDRKRKGRGKGLRGENAPWCKLTWEQVNCIRERVSEGNSLGIVAKNFNVSKATVWNIHKNRIWKI